MLPTIATSISPSGNPETAKESTKAKAAMAVPMDKMISAKSHGPNLNSTSKFVRGFHERFASKPKVMKELLFHIRKTVGELQFSNIAIDILLSARS